MKVGILNGTIATTNGIYKISDIDTADAKKLLVENGFISAIGHKATAEVISELLNIDVPLNRIDFKQEIGQKAIVLKLNKRAAEGSILSRKEMDEIGYSLKLMERVK